MGLSVRPMERVNRRTEKGKGLWTQDIHNYIYIYIFLRQSFRAWGGAPMLCLAPSHLSAPLSMAHLLAATQREHL